MAGAISLRLPATSANLGAAFDSAAVAFDFALELDAVEAAEFSIRASGHNPDQCEALENNLILDTYRALLTREGCAVVPLAITMRNGIPLGMGCGSSAAGRLAAVALAAHFGGFGWSREQVLEEACLLEGHPDNAAACWLGGLVIAATEGTTVHAAQVTPPAAWRAIVAMPSEPLATSKARGVLPETYSRADAVANVQAAALLGLAFQQERGELVRVALADKLHQPYRAEICPLLPKLLPLSGTNGILGVALSGAGPSVLLIVAAEALLPMALAAARAALADGPDAELVVTRFAPDGGGRDWFA